MSNVSVVVFYLDNISNYGEDFLGICTRYLLSQIPGVSVTLASLERRSRLLQDNVFLRKIYNSLLKKSRKYCHRLYVRLYRLGYAANLKKALKNHDAVIIAAGSFKYGTQNLFMDYSLIVEIADEAKIPVFFSGMNIQPYSVTDWRCKYLKEHLNNPIVKMITTRDGQSGVDCLRNEYVTNKELAIDWVGDTGFFIKDCYAASRRSHDCVGINLIASKQFIAYGGNIKEEDVVSFYAGIISYLKEKEIPFECFTNGMPGDVKTHAKICNALGISENDVPLTIPQSDVEAVNLIASYKVVLGARLHACICAYAMDVPFVGFSWDKKILSFGKLTGTQSQFLVEADFNAQNAIKKIMQSHDLVYDCHLREMLKQRAQNAINGFIASVKAGVKTDEKESP